ncbi:MAG: 4Fe-4S binding protein, partial [Firmicutes bacterium]|nr:4Fe-4S binding protein [Bacillota bacterium]
PSFKTNSEKSTRCKMCLKIGCTAIRIETDENGEFITIDPTLCVGCGLCAKLCKFGAILEGGGEK